MTETLERSIKDITHPEPLAALFAGEHSWWAQKLMLSSDLDDGTPLRSFFADGSFNAAIDRYTAASGGADRRAVVSMWSLYYFSGLTIPYLIARQLRRRLLPVSFDEMTIAVGEDGLPRAFGVPHAGWEDRNPSTDSFEAVDPLFETHLFKAVDLLKQNGISAKLCWNNAAVYIDYALRLTEAEGAEPCRSDLPLFVRGCLPNGGVNPFSGCVRQVEDEGEYIARRKLCCLRYMLPGIPSCGKFCALPEKRKQ